MDDGLTPLLEDFQQRNLGGREMPEDLRQTLTVELDCARHGRAGPLKRAGIAFLEPGQIGELARSVVTGRDDLSGTVRLAYSEAMKDMLRLSGFVAEQSSGDTIAYWFEPDRTSLMLFEQNLSFSLLDGANFVEAVLKLASRQGKDTFDRLRSELIAEGVDIQVDAPEAIKPPSCEIRPEVAYEQLVQTYLADLSTTSAPPIAGPVSALNTRR